MLVKLIRCWVEEDQRMAFSNSQLAWQRLSQCDGFQGQMGGWQTDKLRATIIAFWKSEAHLNDFMINQHDDIISHSKQNESTQKSHVDIFDQIISVKVFQPSDMANCQAIGVATLHIQENAAEFLNNATQLLNTTLMTEQDLGSYQFLMQPSVSNQVTLLTQWQINEQKISIDQRIKTALKSVLELARDIIEHDIIIEDPHWRVTAASVQDTRNDSPLKLRPSR